MNRPPLLIWLGLLLLLLLPTAAGRVLLDFAGGLLLLLFALPFLLSGLGWVGWKIIKSRSSTCSSCGAVGFLGSGTCGVCGAQMQSSNVNKSSESDISAPASDVTIEVIAEEVKDDS